MLPGVQEHLVVDSNDQFQRCNYHLDSMYKSVSVLFYLKEVHAQVDKEIILLSKLTYES